MYHLLGICLSLSGLLVINSVFSLLAAVFWRGISGSAARWSGTARAQVLFLLRILPGLMSVLCVGGIFIPAYVAHEPRQTTEIVTSPLGLLAAVSLCGIGFSVWHGISAGIATRRLVRNWKEHAVPVQIRDIRIPAFRIVHPFPVIAVVGAFRPRLFIADRVFRSLSGDEIAAAVSHENGHLVAGDNLKHALLLVCRNILTHIPLGRSMDRAWVEAVESAADERAARGGAEAALDLASALVKVARLVPKGSSPAVPAGISLVSNDLGGIASRVLRLTQLASHCTHPPATDTRLGNFALGTCLCVLFCAAVAAASSSQLLADIHSALERIVSALQ